MMIIHLQKNWQKIYITDEQYLVTMHNALLISTDLDYLNLLEPNALRWTLRRFCKKAKTFIYFIFTDNIFVNFMPTHTMKKEQKRRKNSKKHELKPLCGWIIFFFFAIELLNLW